MLRRAITVSSFLLVTCGGAATTMDKVPVAHVPPSASASVAASAVAPVPVPPHVDYPVPPAQGTPWKAGVGADAALALGASKVFEQGMADPRTLPYREIEIATGDVWSGDGAPTKTHGFVLPGDTYAVAWNGLVYRVRSVGAVANVRTDMAALFAADNAATQKQLKDNPEWTPHRFPATQEAYFTSTTSVTPLKAALLLRLGEDALAARMWAALGDGTKADPYNVIVQDWLWASYDRGITAFMRRDDDLAIESWRTLPELSARVDAECDARHVQRQNDDPKRKRTPCASFLEGIEDLLAEAQRRTGSPSPIMDHARIEALATLPKEQRIAALVAALDQVSAHQMSQPGGVALGMDAIVEALIREGEPAVEPLLAAFENDTRLTRSVQFWRDFARYRSVLAVYEAAYVALSGILDASFFQAVSTGDHLTARGVEGRKAVGAKIREHWTKWKGVPQEERFYRTLQDDNAGPEQWAIAAASITQPSNVRVVPSSNVWSTSFSTPLPQGQKPSLMGESLRAKTSPTVTSLLEKRLVAITEPRAACSFAQAFATWDAHGALPSVVTLVHTTIASYPTTQDKSFAGSCIGTLTNARVDAGDSAALADYGAWIVQTLPEQGDYNLEQWFAPMLAHPKDREIARAAATLFGAKSPWVPFTGEKASYTRERILELDLFKVDAFKKHVIAELSDKKKIGTVKVRSAENIEVKTAGYQSSQSVYPPDPHLKEGQTWDLRMCDGYAAAFAARTEFKGPAFRLFWSLTERDRALRELIAWLEKR